MFRHIRTRIIVFYVTFMLVMLAGYTLYQVVQEQSAYQEQLEQRLVDEAVLVQALMLPELARPQPDQQAIDTLAKQLGHQMQAHITVIGLSGKVLGDSDNDTSLFENYLSHPEVQEALHSSDGFGKAIYFSPVVQHDMFYLAYVVRKDAAALGIVRVALSPTMDNLALQVMIQAMPVALIVAGIAVLIPSLILSALITGPIQEATASVRHITAGKYNQRMRVMVHDEIGDLAMAFNEMAAQIEEVVADLERSRSDLSTILQHLADGVMVIDAERQIQLVNPAATRLLQLPASGVPGQTLLQVTHDSEIELALRRCFERQEEESLTVQRTYHNNPRILGVVITPLPKRTGALLVLQDLTAIHRAEMVRREFVANVSHELRTPLAALKLLVETLQHYAVDDPEAGRHFLEKVDQEVDHLIDLVEDLLLLARLDANQLSLKIQAVDLRQAMQRAVDRFGLLAQEHGLHLQTDPAMLDGEAIFVLADPQRVDQIVANLLSNAIQFTPPGGSIHITISRDPSKQIASFSISDTGIGMATHELERIFERFYQIDPARSPGSKDGSGKGTGLGLSIVKHLVQRLHGQIAVTSQPGRGSTFTVTLPLVSPS